MAFLCIVIDDNKTIGQMANRPDSTKPFEGIQSLINHLEGIVGGANDGGQVQVTVRDTNPSISTSGAGSVQINYNSLK